MVPRIPSWTKGVAVAVRRVPPRPFVDKRCCSCSSPRPSVALRGQKVLQFCSSPCPSVALRGQKVLQLQFSVVLRGPSWTKGVAVLQFSVSLRGSSWTKGVAVAVLRVPPWPFVDKRCCSCSSPCPSVALRGQKVLQLQFSVSLRGSSWTKGVAVLQFSVSLRGPSWTKGVAVAVLRVPLWPFVDKRCCSSAVLRVPPWPFVDKRCCSCSSPCPSVALHGQKVLQLQFSPSLRVPSWTKGVAVAVLRGPPWLFVDKRCCSCSSPCPSVALRGQKVLQLQFSVSLRGPSWTKGVAVAVLRVPPRPFVDKRCCSSAVLRVPPCPSVALRGQKVLQFCSSPCPSVALRGQKVLQLQFSVSLRGSKNRSSCPHRVY